MHMDTLGITCTHLKSHDLTWSFNGFSWILFAAIHILRPTWPQLSSQGLTYMDPLAHMPEHGSTKPRLDSHIDLLGLAWIVVERP